MKWLTQKEIREAAKKSKRATIACTKKHWWQNWQATEEEMRNYAKDHYPISWRRCALCGRYNRSDDIDHKLGRHWCPLKRAKSKTYCCNQYTDALRAFKDWKNNNGNYSTFTKAAKAMYDRICEL